MSVEEIFIRFATMMTVGLILFVVVFNFVANYGATWPGLFKNIKRLISGQKLVKHAVRGRRSTS